ncbi:hypothetical protein BD414DRAFT_501981 [Trametes punicea]|nr:hypothetical protein BD414DRAFT_501981 [Trametes punicea]
MRQQYFQHLTGTTSVAYGPAQPAPNAFTAATQIQRDAESTIWTLDESAGNALTPVWVNSDGTVAALTSVVYVVTLGAFAIIGDELAFLHRFGPATGVTLTFVPLS